MCPSPTTRPGRDADPHALAHRIADAVDTAWHRSSAATGRLEIPLSAVAALALIRLDPDDPEGPAAGSPAAVPPSGMITMLRALWTSYVNLRPDLVPRAFPLFSWLFDPDVSNSSLDAAAAIAQAALRAGQLRLTGTGLRHRVDLFGVVLTTLRSDSARKRRGQFYTPVDVADVMAEMLGITGRDRVHEPAAGTGGMLRAAAQAMRSAGRDPATVTWTAVDVDELAIACLAVNAHLWNLGPRVLLGVGDALTDDWITRAEAERSECLQLAQTVRRDKLALRLLTTVDGPADDAAAETKSSADDRRPAD